MINQSRPTKFLLIFILLLLSIFGCEAQTTVVAQAGETTISADDVAYRQEVMVLRSGQEFPSHLALLQLIEEALMVEVGRSHGVVVGEELLADEAARVLATSRDPEMLARIRSLFGDDETAYHRLILQPTLVNQLLHARFSLDHDIQAESLARAKAVLAAAVADPHSLPTLAKQYNGEYSILEIVGGRLYHGDQPGGEELPGELGQYDIEWPDYDREFVEQVLSGLKIGELHPKVVEDRDQFMVVRLLSQQGDNARLESVVIPKLVFDPWFQAQSQLVPLTVSDQSLKGTLLAEVDVPYITDRLAGER